MCASVDSSKLPPLQRGSAAGPERMAASVNAAAVYTAEEMADEMSAGFNGSRKRLSQPAAVRGLRGDEPRTGEELGEPITGFHQPYEDTGSRETWRLHKVTSEHRAEELISEKLIQGLEPDVHVPQSQKTNIILQFY